MVFGGGTLFTDTESVRACLLWWWHALWAWMLGKRILLAFQGIGPFRSRTGARCARWVARRAAFVSVRDAASLERIRSWGVNLDVVQSFDPVFLSLSSRSRERRTQNLFCMIPRRNSPDAFVLRARVLARGRSWDGVRILSLQPDDPEEQAVCARLAQATHAAVVPVRTIDDLAHAVSGASFVLTQRYHGAIAALALGVAFEVVPQGEGDKLAAAASPPSAVECLALARRGEDALRMALERKIW